MAKCGKDQIQFEVNSRNSENLRANSLPRRGTAYIALVKTILSTGGEISAAGKVWDRIIALKYPVDPKEGFGYSQKLIDSAKPLEARRAWNEVFSLTPHVSAKK